MLARSSISRYWMIAPRQNRSVDQTAAIVDK